MKRKILEVPKIKQLPIHCGPASLSMVLEYYGRDIDQREIALLADFDPEDGVFPPGLAECARNLGYIVEELYESSIQEVISIIRDDIPLIARVKGRKRKGISHLMVIKGYDLDKRVLYFNDPYDLRKGKIDFHSFEKEWVVDNYREKRHWITKNYAISVRPR